MKVFALIIFAAEDIRAAEFELSQFGFFQRGSVQEFMTFTAKTVGDRTKPGVRQSIEQDQYLIHCYVRPNDKLGGIIITDQEYPLRVAFSLLTKITDDFAAKFPAANWPTMAPATSSSLFPELRDALNRFQDPHSADSIMKVQKELDETKVILHKTIESVLDREEKLDQLVDRSNALSMSSKAFYKTAKDNNKCCSLM